MKLSFGGIPIDDLVVPSLVLVCEDQTEFEKFKAMVVGYYEQPGSKPRIDIGFFNQQNQIDFFMDFGASIGKVQIASVDPGIINQLQKGLETFEQYALFLAVLNKNSQLELTPPSSFHMCFSRISIGGELISGSNVSEFDWSRLSEIEDFSRYS